MTEVQALINAVILLPASIAADSVHARECLAHIERRGYRLVGILSDWAAALTMVRTHEAEVVVLARQEHFGADWQPRCEFVGEVTQEIVRTGLTGHCDRNGHAAMFWSRNQVREVLDGTGPIPAGLDPETVAAARRIAWALRNRRG